MSEDLEICDNNDHDRLIRLETRVDSNTETTNSKLDELKTLMTNHLAHHEAMEKTEQAKVEKKSDRWFKISTIILQVVMSGLLTYLILHLSGK